MHRIGILGQISELVVREAERLLSLADTTVAGTAPPYLHTISQTPNSKPRSLTLVDSPPESPTRFNDQQNHSPAIHSTQDYNVVLQALRGIKQGFYNNNTSGNGNLLQNRANQNNTWTLGSSVLRTHRSVSQFSGAECTRCGSSCINDTQIAFLQNRQREKG